MAYDPVQLAQQLRSLPLFAGLDEAAVADLARHAHLVRLDRGQILFEEGDDSDAFFLVLGGRVEIVRRSPEGDSLVLTVATPGQGIGELSVLDREPRSAGAQALERSVLVSMPSARLREAVATSTSALTAVVGELAAMVRRLTGANADMVFLDLPHRLAKLVLAHSVVGPDGSATAELPGSQSAVAAQLGVARQSLNKALGVLTQQGLLDTEGRTVRVPDLAALESYAGG